MEVGADPLCYIGELGPGMPVNMAVPNIGPRLSIVTNKGALLARVGDIGAGLAPGQFLAPHGLAVDGHGDISVGEVSYTAWPRFDFADGPPPADLRSLRKLVRIRD